VQIILIEVGVGMRLPVSRQPETQTNCIHMYTLYTSLPRDGADNVTRKRHRRRLNVQVVVLIDDKAKRTETDGEYRSVEFKPIVRPVDRSGACAIGNEDGGSHK
jgi:hypothetical protein